MRTRKLTPAKRSIAPAYGPSPAPPGAQRFATTLIYCEKDVSLDPNLGLPASYTFSLNGLFDPNVTGTGHQPARFDQLMAMYELYCVYGAKIAVSFQNTQTIGGGATIVGITAADENPTINDCRVLVENGNTVHQILSPRQDGNSDCQLSMYVDIANLQGITRKLLLDGAGARGDATTNPGDGVFGIVWAQGIDAGNPGPVNIFVEITYYAVFLGNKLTALS